MVGAVQPDSFDTLHSYANTFQMPFVTPWFPENVPNPSSGLMDYATSMRPEYHLAIIDLIHYYRWDHIIYLYDSHDGLLRLQEIFQAIRPSRATFEIRVVQRVSSAEDALAFLNTLERNNRWSNKYVVLDCGTEMAKSLIIGHVRDLRMGRRNYHYLLSGLVMDERWEEEVKEFGAVNITGFRIVDTSRPYVTSFLNTWASLDPNVYSGAGVNYISAQAALIYDAVMVVAEALRSLQLKMTDIFDETQPGLSPPQRITCDSAQAEQTIWEHGEKITRLMRKVQVEGLTGNISFTDNGKRTHYSLDVVEMSFNSEAVKLGRWSDTEGFQPTTVNYSRLPSRTLPHNKTYRITTLLLKPFVMERAGNYTGNEKYQGYAKDLADHIATFLNINYTLQVAGPGQYGVPEDLDGGSWNGIIGEIVRKEADLAIAPLTITSTREQVVDFTKPFMTVGVSVMMKKPSKDNAGVFHFMSPLSEEIWMCAVCACIGVSIVLFLVSRFSPYEWKITETYSKSKVTNDFSMSNSLWFVLASSLHQRVDFSPKSASGRLVGAVWWFFTLILISSYTANLAAFLTVQRLATPIKSADDLAGQTQIEYGIVTNGTTREFFERSKISVYSRMWDFMSSRPHVFVSSYDEGIRRVRASKGNFAFLLDSVQNEYYNGQMPCDTIRVGQDLNTNGYGVATPKDSPLRDRLNLAILRLLEDGELDRLRNKWWSKAECSGFSPGLQTNSLTLSSVAGLFYIVTGGLVLSMVVALIEFCYKSKTDATRTKLSLAAAMKAKARLSITGSQDLDNGRFYAPASQLFHDGEAAHATSTNTQV